MLCGNPENMDCLLEVDQADKEVSECRVDITFMGRGCQRSTKCLNWSRVINVVAFASAGDICFVIPEQNNRCIAIKNAVKAHDFPITCLRFISWYQYNISGLDYLITGAADGTIRLWAVRISNKIVVVKLISNSGKA
ncbi:hypothetical protein WUBG_03679 [Wuchereria bancrofti]|uniref:WD_REPEATS_REGION domain-containing protein n=1 Tax=Wuchereria bancrofti TaxID=6293 RepID=J9ET99_WUCBA|nr:hypothetical protein WUBG_03679 [Wuchereria bancrofti]